MLHDLTLDGIALRLRPVRLDDAARIVQLRRNPDLSRFLHETDASVEAQERWLLAYFERPGDYYWAVDRLSDGGNEGFVSIYDVDGQVAEWGRWILRPGSLAAAESAWLVHEAAFGSLGLDVVLTRTLAENAAVVEFHSRYGAETVRTLPAYARIGGVDHDAVECRMSPELWETSGPQLRQMAQRAARLLERGTAG